MKLVSFQFRTKVHHNKYEYTEEEGKITCKLTYTFDVFYNTSVYYALHSSPIIKKVLDKYDGYLTDQGLEFVSYASAKWNCKDEYNYELGKNIAMSRAQAKSYYKAYRVYRDIQYYLQDLSNQFKYFAHFSNESLVKLNNHINKLSK